MNLISSISIKYVRVHQGVLTTEQGAQVQVAFRVKRLDSRYQLRIFAKDLRHVVQARECPDLGFEYISPLDCNIFAFKLSLAFFK